MSVIPALPDLLRDNPYPGRGIVMGLTPDSYTLVIAYFIMGRSHNSRNRVFVKDADSFQIDLFDKNQQTDTGLILYRPMFKSGEHLVLTNGDQTDTIAQGFRAGISFEQALRSRRHEPDAPHFTPRISAVMNLNSGDFTLSILRAADDAGLSCDRLFFEYAAQAGQGRFIHTYLGDENPLPSFLGEPQPVSLPDDIHQFAQEVWTALSPDNKVALYVSGIQRHTGLTTSWVFNHHQEGVNRA